MTMVLLALTFFSMSLSNIANEIMCSSIQVKVLKIRYLE